jgi:hypothetical protein
MKTEYSALPSDEGADLQEQKFKLNYRKLRLCVLSYAFTLYLLCLHFTLVALVILRGLDWKAGPPTGLLLPRELRKFIKLSRDIPQLTVDSICGTGNKV